MKTFVLSVAAFVLAVGVGFAVGRHSVHVPAPVTDHTTVVNTVDQVDSYNDGFADGKADGMAACQTGGR